jgi:hypothetical protein
MTAKTVKTAAFVAATANVPAIIPAYENADFMGRFVTMSADERENALLPLTFGEVAMLGAMFTGAAESANKVMAKKMTAKHGEGWADRKFAGLGRPLTDLEKSDRDAINADIEVIRSALKLKNHPNPTQGIIYIKEWAQGKRGKPRDANANKARPMMQYLREEMPALYKKMHNAEDLDGEHGIAFYDSVGALLIAEGINLHTVLNGK